MDLRTILDRCQGEKSAEWLLLPSGGPADQVPFALVDQASSDESPALWNPTHNYRAVYAPDASISIAWGMGDMDRDGRSSGRQTEGQKPEWATGRDWTSAWPRFAHVLLNGAMVWQVMYAGINWGAGVSGALPWPDPLFGEGGDDPTRPAQIGCETTRWEVDFAALLNDLAGNTEFRFGQELDALDWMVRERHPIEAQRAAHGRAAW